MNELRKRPSMSGYLPAIYQELAGREGLPLRMFIAIFDHLFSGFEDKIDDIDRFFDPYRTSPRLDKNFRDFLSWLASWVVLRLDEGWSEKKKRYLITNAAKLYERRGTLMGLECIIEHFFDIDVEIKEREWPYGMAIGVRSSIGMDTIIEDIDVNQCFVVTCKSAPPLDETEFIEKMSDPGLVEKIRTLIDLEKPAHTQYYLELPKVEVEEEREDKIQPMVIGLNSTIGFCYIGGV